MFGNMRSDRFPRMFSYLDAVRVEASIKPYMKGRNKGDKPLAERSRSQLTIRKVQQLVGEPKVVVRLYQTDIITYYPSGTIEVEQGGYDTPTTHEVIARILGTHICIRDGQGWIDCVGGSFPLRKYGANTFVIRGSYYANNLTYINPEYPKVQKLKRKEYNEIRKRYKQFELYVMASLKVRGYLPPEPEELLNALNGDYEPILLDKLMEMVKDEEQWYAASLIVLRRCKPKYWREELIKEARVKREFKDMWCTHHRHEVFEEIEVRTGKFVRNPNAGYFDESMTRGAWYWRNM